MRTFGYTLLLGVLIVLSFLEMFLLIATPIKRRPLAETVEKIIVKLFEGETEKGV